ncbi:MAG: sulfate adenylyltransferase subunit CysN [Pseudomonadales bacterium]|uniref:sulfate adenylyltransferase subunit CysN n=1 Tax=Moritella sp. TaxID=78556 RepID=UPI001DEAF211|nr:sulfate adenylyltransferase subunit CysN [Moritella sp.]MCJ8313961.1 sulfate adenylyltransferase subunit CysN [Pseudomonadales bacterium]NQZ51004.1 sulfate adenylyltransferase subunit CysN [Moritella sp.]
MSHQSELIAQDINEYLKQHENKELLRFLTCGNVDDGKSTLIGRLLYDSKMIYEDQLAAIESDSKKVGTTGDKLDLALLVDGLAAEREQGITIDVAYRYFSTEKRKFIIADTPGHEQYTRNMATGASNCNVAIILIDARYGVQTQTKRHSFIASLLGIKSVIVAVNKMDLLDFSETRFEEIKKDYNEFSKDLNLTDVHFIPMSALDGDNVVNRSERSEWYKGQTLMETLETIKIDTDVEQDFRMPVQWVNRPNLDFRGFAGTIAAGEVSVGDTLIVLPSGKSSKVKSIVTYDGDLQTAFVKQAVTICLEDEIDVSRGDMFVKPNQEPFIDNKFQANMVWMIEQPLTTGRQFDFKLGTNTSSGAITQIEYKIDVNTLEKQDTTQLELNEIGVCQISLNKAIVFDAYTTTKGTGSFIVIDRLTNVTVGAGMIIQGASTDEVVAVNDDERERRYAQTGAIIKADNAQAALELERRLFDAGHLVLNVADANQVMCDALKAKSIIVITQADVKSDITAKSGLDAFIELSTKEILK